MNGRTRALLGALALLVASFGGATPSHAARCGGDFGSFVQNMSAEAQGAGVSANVVSAALGGVQQDGAVLAFDRRGLVRDVSGVLADARLSIDRMTTVTHAADRTADMTLAVKIHDLAELESVVARIAGLPDVIRVQRR